MVQYLPERYTIKHAIWAPVIQTAEFIENHSYPAFWNDIRILTKGKNSGMSESNLLHKEMIIRGEQAKQWSQEPSRTLSYLNESRV
jgi:hypothetical protein